MSLGTLYVVATPIGNLEDGSPRMRRILGEVDLIAAEDTRRTRKLLSFLDLHTPMTSYYRHNEAMKTASIVQMLQEGKSVALVTDAGTPGIADPGGRLVAGARAAGCPVVPIPGPAALTTALSISGLPTERFTFVGFLPDKKGRRRKLLQDMAALEHTLIFYIARWDLTRYLQEMGEVLGARDACLCRELTKQFEEVKTGTLAELAAWADDSERKGEMTLVVGGKS